MIRQAALWIGAFMFAGAAAINPQGLAAERPHDELLTTERYRELHQEL
jgi:hypothetical protein